MNNWITTSISLIALSISICVAWFTYEQLKISKASSTLSVTPFVGYSPGTGKDIGLILRVENKGLGPANITVVEAYLGNYEKSKKFDLTKLKGVVEFAKYTNSYIKGGTFHSLKDFLSPGRIVDIIEIPPALLNNLSKDEQNKLANKFRNIRLRIEYLDIYRNKCILSDGVTSCPTIDKLVESIE